MTDQEVQHNVQRALEWEPSIDATEVGVTVENGVVTLRGDVRSYSEKETAERVTQRIYGVKAVANDINVRLVTEHERTDSEIAQAVVNALKWSTSVPEERVKVTVSNGWVTLSGALDWHYQRDAAGRAVRDLMGVRGVTNSIVVQPSVTVGGIQGKIEEAFKRSAEIDARRITVSIQNNKVTLTGNVHTWAERREAERAAWAAPGVTGVEDYLVVVP